MTDIERLKVQINNVKTALKEKRQNNADTTIFKSAEDVGPIGKLPIRCRRQLKGHLAKIFAFDWDQNSKKIVSASQDGNLIMWDTVASLKTGCIPLKSNWVVTCAYSPLGNFVASGGLDNMCTIYKITEMDSKHRIYKELIGHEAYISSCVFSGEEKIITSSGDANSILWDIAEGKSILTLLGHTSDICKICSKPADLNIVATGSADGTVRIWDLRNSNPCVQMFEANEADVNSIAFHPCGTVVASVAEDGSCKLWDLSADNQVGSYNLDINGVAVASSTCSFSKSGRVIFIGQDNNIVTACDTLRGDIVAKLTDHENKISCLQVSPDGDALCTSSWDNIIRIYA